jgi:predicted alpha/beta hydrolase family esterase
MIFTGTAARGLKTQASDFSDTATKTKQLIKLHKVMRPGSKMTLAGHSLGGSMVAHMMSDPKIAKYVDQAHAFSIGAGPWGHPSYPKHLHLHISDIDPISLFEKERSGATFHYHTGHSLAETHWQSRWEDRPYWEGYDYNTFTYEERDDLIETAPVPELESGAGWKDEL